MSFRGILFLFEAAPTRPMRLEAGIQINGDGGLGSSVALWRDRDKLFGNT